jgi:chorismate mutase
MTTLALRGATSLDKDDLTEMHLKVVELVTEMLGKNNITQDSVISILFTGTPDISSAFPAMALRSLGFSDTPLICAQEMNVQNAESLLIRVLMHVEVSGSLVEAKRNAKHQYLHRAAKLRPDIAEK